MMRPGLRSRSRRFGSAAGWSRRCRNSGRAEARREKFRRDIRRETSGETSGLPDAHSERTPMAAADEDRRRQILHQHELASAHIAPVGLYEERPGAGGDLLHGAVVEQPPVAAIGVV